MLALFSQLYLSAAQYKSLRQSSPPLFARAGLHTPPLLVMCVVLKDLVVTTWYVCCVEAPTCDNMCCVEGPSRDNMMCVVLKDLVVTT